MKNSEKMKNKTMTPQSWKERFEEKFPKDEPIKWEDYGIDAKKELLVPYLLADREALISFISSEFELLEKEVKALKPVADADTRDGIWMVELDEILALIKKRR